jgi:hypothetical protein
MPSFAEVSARRRWQESPVTGKSTKETVKTIVRGRPDCFGEPVVTTLVCFFNSHARLRVHQAPGFPCALYFSGPTMTQNSDASASRECESVSLRYLTIKSEMNDAGDIEMTSSCPRKSAKRVFALDVAGHPRLPFCPPAKAWMAGSSPAMTAWTCHHPQSKASSPRPAMTSVDWSDRCSTNLNQKLASALFGIPPSPRPPVAPCCRTEIRWTREHQPQQH